MSLPPDSNLRYAFHPGSVAVIGASADEKAERSEGWIGRLQQYGFKGRLYPVNPRATEIMGMKAYASVKDIPDPVDYAIITVPAPVVPKLVDECVAKGVKVVHIHTGGFGDAFTEEGKQLHRQLEEVLEGSSTRVIGPNCLGVYCPSGGMSFNTSFPKTSGPVAMVAQTASALIGLIPVADARGIGFSKVVSYGNAVDLDSPEFVEHLADDPDTECVFVYLEGVKDGRQLLDAVARCNHRKPVVILKGGVTQGGVRAIQSHTATLVGSGHVWQAFFKQTGAVAVETFDEALNQLTAFRYMKPPAGRRVGLVGLGGGWSVVATDICEREGLVVPGLSEETTERLGRIKGLEIGRGIRNPLEVGLGKFGLPKNFAEGMTILAADPQIDFILAQFYPAGYVGQWTGTKPMDDAMDLLIETAKGLSKPVVASIGLGYDAHSMAITINAHKRCYEAGMPVFFTPDQAARAVSKLIGYHEQSSCHSRASGNPASREASSPATAPTIVRIIENAQREGRTYLNEIDSKQVLASAGVPVTDTRLAKSGDEAAALAAKLGYPVALKVVSSDVVHKSDIGGVKLGLGDDAAVRKAYEEIVVAVSAKQPEARIDGLSVQGMARPGVEVIIGVSRDEQFGPVVMFGIGGTTVELLKDVSFRIAPITQQDAAEMIREIKGFPLLEGYRGSEPVNIQALEDMLLKVSELAAATPQIEEMDLNPVFARPNDAIAVDARIILGSPQG